MAVVESRVLSNSSERPQARNLTTWSRREPGDDCRVLCSAVVHF